MSSSFESKAYRVRQQGGIDTALWAGTRRLALMITPFFPSLRPLLAPMGSRSQTAVRSLSQQTLAQIEERLAPALDPALFEKPDEKDHSRDRIFSLVRTFWCWIWQVLQANTSCREVVRQVQALFAAFSGLSVDEGNSAYCKARKKLALALLQKAFDSSHASAEKLAPRTRLLQGRPQKIVDGSSFVTSGRGQPTMTIQALAFRAGDHIANFARRGEI